MIKFSAKYSAVIDDKGRVVLPSALKKAMGDQAELPVTLEMDAYTKCLNIYPEVYWNQIVDTIESKLNLFNQEDMEFWEQFHEHFTVVKMAPNGRINIPPAFLEHTKAKKEVVFVGLGKMIRLWDAKAYEERSSTRQSYSDLYREKLDDKSKNKEQ